MIILTNILLIFVIYHYNWYNKHCQGICEQVLVRIRLSIFWKRAQRVQRVNHCKKYSWWLFLHVFIYIRTLAYLYWFIFFDQLCRCACFLTVVLTVLLGNALLVTGSRVHLGHSLPCVSIIIFLLADGPSLFCWNKETTKCIFCFLQPN